MSIMWEVEFTDEFGRWWETLTADQQEAIDDRVMLLAENGPGLRRPVVGEIKSSRHTNMKELEPRREVRSESSSRSTLADTRSSCSEEISRASGKPGIDERSLKPTTYTTPTYASCTLKV